MVGVWCCGTVRHSIDLLRRRWSANIGLTSGKVVAGGSHAVGCVSCWAFY